MPIAQARCYLLLAAVLWSSSSFFMRMLREPTGWLLDEPQLSPLQIAVYRALFAGLILLPIVPWREVHFRPLMLGMVASFALMSGFYLSALGLGPAANAILLQNTAPVWVYLIGVYGLGHDPDRRTWRAIILGLIGALVLILGNSLSDLGSADNPTDPRILALGLGSGFAYAVVILFLRHLRMESTAWLTLLNLLGSGLILAACVCGHIIMQDGFRAAWQWWQIPTARQLGFIAVFGLFQMAAPYWLFTRGLRVVGPQEAGIITLLEPILNPIWAYLIAPEKEIPTVWTLVGGFILLIALAWRYYPATTDDD